MQRQAAAIVHELVPHPQPALLRLAEVVRVEDAGDVQVEVDGDQPIVGVARRREPRRVHDHELGLEVGLGIVEVEDVLHPGDVREGRLDEEPGRNAVLGVVADEAVDLDHGRLGDVGVLARRHAVPLVAVDRLVRIVSGSSATMNVEPFDRESTRVWTLTAP